MATDNGQMDTTMVITLTDATEVVTVETEDKENSSSSKLKMKKNTPKEKVTFVKAAKKDKNNNNEQVSGAENREARKHADSGLTEIQRAPTVTLLQADNPTQEASTDTEVFELQLHDAQFRNITVRNRTRNRRKTSKPIVESCDTPKSYHDDELEEQEHSEANPHICPHTRHSDGLHGVFLAHTARSCKRPWVATLQDIPEDLSSSPPNHDMLPLGSESTTIAEFRRPKRARRENWPPWDELFSSPKSVFEEPDAITTEASPGVLSYIASLSTWLTVDMDAF